MKRALLVPFVLASFGLAACKQYPTVIEVSDVVVAGDGVDFSVAFTHLGKPVLATAKEGTITSRVTDADYREFADVSKTVCTPSIPSAAGVEDATKTKLRYHVSLASCPALREKFYRAMEITYAPPKGDHQTTSFTIQKVEAPKQLTDAERLDIAFKKALPLIPRASSASQDSTSCTEEYLRSLRPSYLKDLRTISWDDAARAYGVQGASDACKALFDFKSAMSTTERLVYVYRANTCTMPVLNEAAGTYKPGSTFGTVALMDTNNGKVLCHGFIQAVSSPKFTTSSKSATAFEIMNVDLRLAVEKAAKSRLMTISPLLER